MEKSELDTSSIEVTPTVDALITVLSMKSGMTKSAVIGQAISFFELIQNTQLQGGDAYITDSAGRVSIISTSLIRK